MKKKNNSNSQRIKNSTIFEPDVAQIAVTTHNRIEASKNDQKKEAALRLTTSPFNVTTKQIIADLEEDYYKQ
jgi:hypothetical protein